ncbi:MAG: DUF6206 family protein [bacterium]|nr:DUF6206 family protein [bacterium]
MMQREFTQKDIEEIERVLKEFESIANFENPEKSKIPFEILGYGEISVVISIKGLESFVLKRLPIFRNYEECLYYKGIFDEYGAILKEKVGLRIPKQFGVIIRSREPVFYSVQERLSNNWLCQQIFNSIDSLDSQKLTDGIISEIYKVCNFNNSHKEKYKIGIDGQLSNWALENGKEGLNQKNPHFIYLDTSTPLIKENGREKIPADNFLMSIPPALKFFVKKLFLKEVLERYYDCRSVILDFSSNLMNEKNTKNVKNSLKLISEKYGIKLQEIISYHKRDYIIWRTFLTLRKIHRLILTNVLHRKYRFLLPPEISVKKITKEDIKYFKE